MDISGNDLKVLCFFIKYNNFMKQMYFSIQYIATKTKLSKRCVQSCLASLRNKNVLTWKQRENKTNIYTLNQEMLKKGNGKNCQELNTNNLTNYHRQNLQGDKYKDNEKEKVNPTKYVNIEVIQRELKTITKRTNIFYKQKVEQNKGKTYKERAEKRAWVFLAEMEGSKREQVLKEIGNDLTKWKKFVEKVDTMMVYRQGRLKNR